MNNRVFLCVMLLLLSACGTAGAPTPTVAPSAEPTAPAQASPTTVPSATSVPSPTSVPATVPPSPTTPPTPSATSEPTPAPPTAVPTIVPSPTTRPAVLSAVYECDAGLCWAPLDGTPPQALVAFDHSQQQLAGFNVSADGTQVLYGLGELYGGSATLHSVPIVGGADQTLFDVAGAESGTGGLEGFGALGFTPANDRIVFEDQAQVFAANLDGSDRRAVNEQWRYGASSFHWYSLSPGGGFMYQAGSNQPNQVTIFKTTEAYSAALTLDAADVPEGFLDEGHTLLARMLDPSLDEIDTNPATVERKLVGYALYDVESGQRTPVVLGNQALGQSPPALLSTIAGEQAIAAYEDGLLMLADLRGGRLVPTSLAGYKPGGRIVLFLLQR
ncbi:MAG TPA: hypothetical protein VFT99_25655 [Roseiflexaceae bacterium]|nr:hypothetical protein [Roseiflexaceae bacterium]